MRRRWLALALVLGLILPAMTSIAGSPSRVLSLKVAYLYNFTRFVEWPQRRSDGDFVISVIGDPEIAEALGLLEREHRQAGGAPIRIRQLRKVSEIGRSRILFIGAGALARLPSILAVTARRPILLVGDTPGLAERGVAINFFLKQDILGEGERLRFQINPAALKGRGLEVSAQLYDVAEIIR